MLVCWCVFCYIKNIILELRCGTRLTTRAILDHPCAVRRHNHHEYTWPCLLACINSHISGWRDSTSILNSRARATDQAGSQTCVYGRRIYSRARKGRNSAKTDNINTHTQRWSAYRDDGVCDCDLLTVLVCVCVCVI